MVIHTCRSLQRLQGEFSEKFPPDRNIPLRRVGNNRSTWFNPRISAKGAGRLVDLQYFNKVRDQPMGINRNLQFAVRAALAAAAATAVAPAAWAQQAAVATTPATTGLEEVVVT